MTMENPSAAPEKQEVHTNDSSKKESSLSSSPVPAAIVAATVRNGERPACFKSTFAEALFVLTATLAVAMSTILVGTTTVIYNAVGRDLKMTTAEITWMNAAASLTSGSFLFFFGRIADLFGRRILFLASFLAFSLLSLGAAFAKTPITIDVLCGLIGLASAASVPPAQGILGTIYEKPSKRKNIIFAAFSAGSPLGFVMGTIFSGVAASLFDWRASFIWLAILFAVFTGVAWWVVPGDEAGQTEEREKFELGWEVVKRFDLVGIALTVAGVGMLSCGLSLGGDAKDGWRTPYVIVLLVLGFVSIVGFVFWEKWYTYPLIPMHIWKDRDFSLLNLILVLGFIGFSAESLWASLYLQDVKGYPPLQVALHLLPMAISGLIANFIAGVTMHRVSNKLLIGIGAFCFTLACTLLALQRSHDSYWAFMFPALVIIVVGADFEFCVVNMYVLSSLPLSQQSIGGSIIQTSSKLCVAISYGISTAVFQAVEGSIPKTGYYANDPAYPYAAAFWMCMAFCAISLLIVPFLRIGTQGNDVPLAEEVVVKSGNEVMV